MTTDHQAPAFGWFQPTRDESPVEIVVHRSMLVLRAGEDHPRHADQGERVTVPAWILGALPPGSFTLA